jgi:hypothetical protein
MVITVRHIRKILMDAASILTIAWVLCAVVTAMVRDRERIDKKP